MRNRRGFALIELMLIVAVLSLAASFFVPRFLKDQIRKRQDICSQNLTSFYRAQKGYREAHGTFAKDEATLGWTASSDSSDSGSSPYEYRLIRSGKHGFLLECSGNIDKDPTLDEASIDESGQITRKSDDIKK